MKATLNRAETVQILEFKVTDGVPCGISRINGAPRRIRVQKAHIKFVDGVKVQASVHGPVIDSAGDIIPNTWEVRFWAVDPKAFGNDPIDRLPFWLKKIWDVADHIREISAAGDRPGWSHIWPELEELT